MRKILFSIVCMALWATVASAKDVYIAQNASGAATGSDCADALAWNAFSNSANWVAGNTLHICGAHNIAVNGTGITALGSGSSGKPITIFFEPGASLTSPAMSIGIDVNGKNYITINGGPLISGILNGTIQNTANGYGLAYQVSSPKCVYNPGSNVTVEYISCHSLYITTTADTSGNDEALGISVGANGVITHCSFDHGDLGLAGANASNVEISYNTVNYTNHEITVGTSGNPVSNIRIHDNDLLGGGYIYDGNGSAYHRDGIIVICENSGNPCVTGLLIYNNRFTGAMSKLLPLSGTTSLFFMDDYATSQIQSVIFDNVVVEDFTSNGVNNAYINNGYQGQVYNNTIFPQSGKGGSCQYPQQNNPQSFVENNIFVQCGLGVYSHSGGAGGWTIDYNLYYLINAWSAGSGFINTFSSWQTNCGGCDSHSISGKNPNLTSTFTLNSGSPAIGTGKNLTSLGIPELNIGAPQTFGYNGSCGTGCVARPSSGPWDLGAYPSGSTTVVQPDSPSGLVATVN